MSNQAPNAADMDDTTRTRASMTTPTGYTLKGYTEMPARNGIAWGGTIHKDGTEVGRVNDSGWGGMLDFEWTSSKHMYDFRTEAKARYGDNHIEAADAFAHDLATAAQNNRKRAVIFITDDSDLSMGECFAFKATVTLAQAKTTLLSPTSAFKDKNPMIWDKSQSIFVPAADIEV